MKKLVLFASFISLAFLGFAQNAATHRTCGSPVPPDEYEVWMQSKIREFQTLQQTGRVQTHYNIPVVVHVVHNGENVGVGSNISLAQINSQIDVLNEDYRRHNADTTLTPTVFKPVAADIDVNFHLASVDQNGNASTGIDRINRNTKGWTAPPYSKTYIDATIKPNSIWNPNNFLNIWVLNTGGSLLGYAYFPPQSTLQGFNPVYLGTMTTDGVVIYYQTFARVGSLLSGYDLGRTASHEVGHYLGLRHISGDVACGNDYCADTPPQTGGYFGGQGGLNYGCPTPVPFQAGMCTGNANGEMFMNFMDYVDDNCYNMFTNDQKTRMQTALLNSPMRNQLHAGVAENSVILEGVSVYPNPSKGQLNIAAPLLRAGSDLEINIINILGKAVYHSVKEVIGVTFNLDLSTLNNGLYIMQLKNEKGTFTQRIDINK